MQSMRFSNRCRATLLVTLLSLLTSRASFADEPKSENYTWSNAVIHGGGFVSGIVTHPKAKGVIYARTDIGGAYRWDEANRRWIPITDWINAADWNYTGIESLAVDPSDPNKVFFAGGSYTSEWAKGNAAI